MGIVLIRTIIVYVCIVAALRVMGKRQLGQLELSELVVAVLISDMAAHPLQDIGIPLLNGLLPIAVLLCCELLITWLSLKNRKLRQVFFGKPSILIRNGKIIQTELTKNRFSLDELSEQLRGKGVTDPSRVASAVLETDGTLNVLLRCKDSPVTPEQMQLNCDERGVPITLISDGQVETDNLRLLGHDSAWLMKKLGKSGIQNPADVFYMTIDEKDGVYLQRKEKKV